MESKSSVAVAEEEDGEDTEGVGVKERECGSCDGFGGKIEW